MDYLNVQMKMTIYLLTQGQGNILIRRFVCVFVCVCVCECLHFLCLWMHFEVIVR